MRNILPGNPLLLLTVMLAIAATSCHKKDHGGDTPPLVDTTNTTLADRQKDTLYYITKDEYLWTDAMPDYATFKPRQFSGMDAELEAIKAFKRDSLDPTKARDHYSFLDDGTVSGELNGGVSGDFGFNIQYFALNDIRSIYVYPGSPAGKAGVKRSWKLTAVNGDTSLYYDYNASTGHGTNYDRLVDAFYNSASTSFTFQKPDGTSATVNLSTATYSINPLLFSKIYNVGGKKIGYFVFNQFLSLSLVQTRLDSLFGAFSSAGVTDVIADIRYNGGGAVETSEYLANLLAPSSVGTGLMYTEYFNTTLTSKNYNAVTKAMRIENGQYRLTDEYDYLVSNNKSNFAKKGSLSPQHVVFIATGNTASASELLINNLKPVLPSWKQVGRPTYGKPVGFIGITIGQSDLYAISFSIKNSQGVGDYYYGLQPTEGSTREDAAEDFGDVNEIYLNEAFHALGITDSDLNARQRATSFDRRAPSPVGQGIPLHNFVGMVKRLPHQ